MMRECLKGNMAIVERLQQVCIDNIWSVRSVEVFGYICSSEHRLDNVGERLRNVISTLLGGL